MSDEASAPVEAAPVTETPAAPAAAPETENPRQTAALAAMARRDRALQQRERALKEQQAKWESERTEWQTKLSEVDKLKEIAKTNPAAVMERFGINYQDFTQWVLNDGKPTPELVAKASEDRVRKLEERIEADRKSREEEKLAREAEYDKERQAQWVHQFKGQISEHLKSKPDDYELIHALGEEDEVFALISGAYEQSKGETLYSIPEAAAKVEAWLTERARRAQGAKKFKPVAPPAAVTEPVKQETPEPKDKGKTLSNKDAAPVPESDPYKGMTKDQRKEAALALIKAQRKK